MGTPLPKNEPRDDCTICWGPGKPFGDSPTPRFIAAQFTQFLPGQLWLPEYDILLLTTRDLEPIDAPCQWQIIAAGFQWFLNFTPDFTFFMIIHIASGKRAFWQPNAPLCALDIQNSDTQPFDRITYGGFINLTWNPEDI